MVTAKWNDMEFKVQSDFIYSFSELDYSLEIGTSEKTDGKQKYVAIKDVKPRAVTVKLPLSKLTGADVQAEIDRWMKQAYNGTKDYFYVGGAKLVPCQVMLTKVDVSDVKFTPPMVMLSALLTLAFKQCAKMDGTKSVSSGTGGASSGTPKKASVTKSAIAVTKKYAAPSIAGAAGGGASASNALQKAQAETARVQTAAKTASAAKVNSKPAVSSSVNKATIK